MLEVVILAVVVILLGTIFVLYRRNNRPAKAGARAGGGQSPASYYSDVNTMPGTGMAQAFVGGGQSAQPDPFAGFGTAPTPADTGSFAAPVMAPPPPPPLPAPAIQPAPGTPAGWMPDPSGALDTLRYWDGNGWTQHVAKRN
jgi:hypothetical protein